MNMTKVRRAAAYCRVSTDDDRQDGSFEAQCAYYRRKIEEDPALTLAGIYGDPGKSGRLLKGREGLRQLMADCEAGLVDVIYTKSVSRFARNLAECIAAVRHLNEWGVAVVFEREGLDTAAQESELLLGLMATVAQEESRSIGQNLKWARRRQCERGQPAGRVSYGYRAVGRERRWEIQPEEARQVRLAFYLAGCGRCYADIRAALNAGETARGTGRVWNTNPVRYLLTNVAYIGDVLTNKECLVVDGKGARRGRNRGQAEQFYIEEHHEALVSRALFARVGALVERRLLFSNRRSFSAGDLSFIAACRGLARREMAEFAGREGV